MGSLDHSVTVIRKLWKWRCWVMGMRISCYWNKYPQMFGLFIKENRKHNFIMTFLMILNSTSEASSCIACIYLQNYLMVVLSGLEDWVVKLTMSSLLDFISLYIGNHDPLSENRQTDRLLDKRIKDRYAGQQRKTDWLTMSKIWCCLIAWYASFGQVHRQFFHWCLHVFSRVMSK